MFSISLIAVLLQNPRCERLFESASACFALRLRWFYSSCFYHVHLHSFINRNAVGPKLLPVPWSSQEIMFFFKNVLVAPAPLRIQSFRKRTKNVNVLETHAKPMVLHGFDVLDVFVFVLDRRRRFCRSMTFVGRR